MKNNFDETNTQAPKEEIITIKFALRPVKTYKLLKLSISNFKNYSFISQMIVQFPSGKSEKVLQITINYKNEEIVINNESEWNDFIKENFEEISNTHSKQNILKMEFEYISAVQHYIMNSSPSEVLNQINNAILHNRVIQHELKKFFANEIKKSSQINRSYIESNIKNTNANSNSLGGNNKNSFGEIIVNKLNNILNRINDINQCIEESTIISMNNSDLVMEESIINESLLDRLGKSIVSVNFPQQESVIDISKSNVLPLSIINENNENINNKMVESEIKNSSFSKLYNENKKIIHDQMIRESCEMSKRYSIYNNNFERYANENK